MSIIVLIVSQFLLLAVLMFGDIGFDHPGRFGMSFDHGLFLSFLYLVALIAGLLNSATQKSWKTALLQILPVVILGSMMFS